MLAQNLEQWVQDIEDRGEARGMATGIATGERILTADNLEALLGKI